MRLLNEMPVLSPAHESLMNRFFRRLEEQGRSFLELTPPELEREVNQAMRENFDGGLRAAVNLGFGLDLRAPSGKAKRTPKYQEHVEKMKSLPEELSQPQKSLVNGFLCRLEKQNTALSTLMPDPSNELQPQLEAVVNDLIDRDELPSGTRGALNEALGVLLVGPSGMVRRAPSYPEHLARLNRIPQGTTDHSYVNSFLCYLETLDRSYSSLDDDSGHPPELERVVNDAIALGDILPHTRSALCRSFGIELRPPRDIERASRSQRQAARSAASSSQVPQTEGSLEITWAAPYVPPSPGSGAAGQARSAASSSEREMTLRPPPANDTTRPQAGSAAPEVVPMGSLDEVMDNPWKPGERFSIATDDGVATYEVMFDRQIDDVYVEGEFQLVELVAAGPTHAAGAATGPQQAASAQRPIAYVNDWNEVRSRPWNRHDLFFLRNVEEGPVTDPRPAMFRVINFQRPGDTPYDKKRDFQIVYQGG